MNRASLYAGIAAVVIMAFPATAQNVGVGVGPVGVGIDFSPEQRTVVREYVRRDRPAAFREQVVVGSAIPDDVEIRAVPREWGPVGHELSVCLFGEPCVFHRAVHTEGDSRP